MPAGEDPSQPRLTGEARYKADLNATAQRNAEARRSAAEHQSPNELAVAQRESRLAQVETEQLDALNEKLAARRLRRAT
jgi:hypothetical protein